MTRVYGFNLTCDVCHQRGPFGWVYRCTQDREDYIESVVAHGYMVKFHITLPSPANVIEYVLIKLLPGTLRQSGTLHGFQDDTSTQKRCSTSGQTQLLWRGHSGANVRVPPRPATDDTETT